MTSQPTVSTAMSSKNVDSQTVKASLYPLQPLEGPVPVGFQTGGSESERVGKHF